MANKRMFSLSVVDTDKFLQMPISARLLYYELGMRADDDGFVDNLRKILLFTGLKEDDVKILIAKQFIIPFESGVIVIRHWRMNNYLQNDRTKPTIHQKEYEQLGLDNNNVYNLDTKCIHREEEKRIEENREEKEIYKEKEKRFKKPTFDEVEEYCKERNNNINPQKFIDFYESKGWMVGKNKMKDWKACVRTWERTANTNDLPNWFGKDIKQQGLTDNEIKEMEDLLNNF